MRPFGHIDQLILPKQNISRNARKLGMEPGSIVYLDEKRVESVRLVVTDYDGGEVIRKEISSLADLPEKRERVRWLHLQGLHDTALLNQIGKKFNIHPLVLEDITNPHHPPKIEEYDGSLFVIIKMLKYDDQAEQLLVDQISLVLLPDMLISFQETDADYFAPVLKRLENPQGRLRKLGVDYLLYVILDLIVDHYYLVIDLLEDRFEEIEETMIKSPQLASVEDIHRLKRQVIYFRKAARPLRELVNLLMAEEVTLMSETIAVYLRDLYDHTIQVIDALETQRDLVAGLMDTYLSQVNYRMNEVMKVLTIISTIFIPLSFLVGIYGMNFDHMPELHFRWGYFILLGIMGLLLMGMLIVFKRKKWF